MQFLFITSSEKNAPHCFLYSLSPVFPRNISTRLLQYRLSKIHAYKMSVESCLSGTVICFCFPYSISKTQKTYLPLERQNCFWKFTVHETTKKRYSTTKISHTFECTFNFSMFLFPRNLITKAEIWGKYRGGTFQWSGEKWLWLKWKEKIKNHFTPLKQFWVYSMLFFYTFITRFETKYSW